MEALSRNKIVMDLGIIGGGPAGAVAAIEAARSGLQVVIWDRSSFPRDKVCGEFLSPESLPQLENLIAGTLRRRAPVCRAEFYSRKGQCYSVRLPRPGAGLSRVALDAALWRAAAAEGVSCREGEAVIRVVKFRDQPADGMTAWDVSSSTADPTRVRHLVLACGRWWNVNGLPSPAASADKEPPGEWMGAKAHFSAVDTRDAVEMYFFPGGYCGLAPVEDGIYNACFLVRRSLARNYGGGGIADFRTWINEVARHPALAARLRLATQTTKTITTAPVRPARRAPELAGAMAVGDAAGFLDPFTGDGISIAVHSGQLAARELARGFRQGASSEAFRRYQLQHARGVRSSYFSAALLRILARAPAEIQDCFAAAMPSFLGSRLLSATRWRV